MNHLILLLVCILSVEIFLKINPVFYITLIFITIKKVVYVSLNKKISDHWKEIVIPIYAIIIMKLSVQIFLIFLFIISIFLVAGIYINEFIIFLISFVGITESLVYICAYNFFRKLILK